MASTDKPNGGASFPTQDTAAAAAAGYENNGELPTYLLSPELADPAGRRPLTMLPPPPPLPPSSISPMPSPYLGGIGLVPPLVVSTAFQNPPLVPPVMYAAGHTMAPMVRSSSNNENNWREPTEEMRRLRARNVILVERMLTNHQPHDVLTQVPENFNWHSKTFALAIKIERLMFASATSRENYLDEATLRSRVQILSRHLVRIRKRKNAMASAYANT